MDHHQHQQQQGLLLDQYTMITRVVGKMDNVLKYKQIGKKHQRMLLIKHNLVDI